MLACPKRPLCSQIVSQTGVKRSSIDVILQRLCEENIVFRVKTGNRYCYVPERPEILLQKQKQTLSDLEALLPILARLGHSPEATEVRFFEGRDGVRQIYDDILIHLKLLSGDKRQLLSFANGQDMMRVFPDMQSRFIDKRVRLGAIYKSIVPASSLARTQYVSDPQQLREIKAVDDTRFPFEASIETYGDNVMMYSPSRPYGGIVIRNKSIASSVRSLFFLVWNFLP